LDLFRSLDIPASPLRTPAELLDNEHLKAVGMFETVDSEFGPVRFPGIPTGFSRTPGGIAGPAPTLGAHTEEVLAEFGLTATARPVRG
jgi:crotonobetainyl-CoA:carnitine CoA-transferase CaiB-like acyl-CoA transferase